MERIKSSKELFVTESQLLAELVGGRRMSAASLHILQMGGGRSETQGREGMLVSYQQRSVHSSLRRGRPKMRGEGATNYR